MQSPLSEKGGDGPSEACSLQSPLFQLLLQHFYGCSIGVVVVHLLLRFNNGRSFTSFLGAWKLWFKAWCSSCRTITVFSPQAVLISWLLKHTCVCFQGYSLSVWMCIDSKIRPAAHAPTQKRETRVRAAVFHIRTRHRLLTIELREKGEETLIDPLWLDLKDISGHTHRKKSLKNSEKKNCHLYLSPNILYYISTERKMFHLVLLAEQQGGFGDAFASSSSRETALEIPSDSEREHIYTLYWWRRTPRILRCRRVPPLLHGRMLVTLSL